MSPLCHRARHLSMRWKSLIPFLHRMLHDPRLLGDLRLLGDVSFVVAWLHSAASAGCSP